MIEERDLRIRMRDGVHLALDIYRPDRAGPYPVLYASALHNKDMQGPDMADVLASQPAHAPLWFGPLEAGDTRRFIANGYVHVIGQPRGSAKSEGHRALDPTRSKLGEPFHKLTRDSIEPVKAGEIVEYQIQLLATANRFKAGHRICLEITTMDVPTGTGAMTNVEYIPYHVCRSETVTHSIYHDAKHPSHLLVPIIPDQTSAA